MFHKPKVSGAISAFVFSLSFLPGLAHAEWIRQAVPAGAHFFNAAVVVLEEPANEDGYRMRPRVYANEIVVFETLGGTPWGEERFEGSQGLVRLTLPDGQAFLGRRSLDDPESFEFFKMSSDGYLGDRPAQDANGESGGVLESTVFSSPFGRSAGRLSYARGTPSTLIPIEMDSPEISGEGSIKGQVEKHKNRLGHGVTARIPAQIGKYLEVNIDIDSQPDFPEDSRRIKIHVSGTRESVATEIKQRRPSKKKRLEFYENAFRQRQRFVPGMVEPVPPNRNLRPRSRAVWDEEDRLYRLEEEERSPMNPNEPENLDDFTPGNPDDMTDSDDDDR